MSSELKSPYTHQPLFQHRGAPDIVQDVPFNLTLTASQHQSRARVPLPYSHNGEASYVEFYWPTPNVGAVLPGQDTANKTSDPAVIHYDPDSADDIDDDDPDEDLDI
jgi:elongator complex protein 5